MDKITNITLLPQDQLNRLQNEAGRVEEKEFLIMDRTMYTSNSDGLGPLRKVAAKRPGDNKVEIGLIRGTNIVVTRKGIPDPVSPTPSDQTDQGATGCDYGDPGEEYGKAPHYLGANRKQRNLIAGFSPLTREGGFEPYQTSTERKINGIRARVQVETEPNHSSGSEDTEDDEILGGRKCLTYPGHVFAPLNSQLAALRGPEQKIVQLACGLTADEILDMPGTSTKAKYDMLAKQLDCMQKALCYILLDDHTKDKYEPAMREVWKLREASRSKPPPPKGKVPRKQQKAAPPKRKNEASTSPFSEEDRAREEYRQEVENGGEPSDSPSSSDSDTEEESRRPKKPLSVKPQIDLSILASVSRQNKTRTLSESDSEEEVIVSKPRRGSARQTKGDSLIAIQLLLNMKFPGAKDNNMLKAKMVADLGKTIGASTSLVERMIEYHTGLSMRLEILNAYYSLVIGIDKEAEFRKEIEMVKTTGLWVYLAGKATQGWTEEKMLAKLKKLALELPGCREIASWGADTDWSKMSKFAARYDRKTESINRMRKLRPKQR